MQAGSGKLGKHIWGSASVSIESAELLLFSSSLKMSGCRVQWAPSGRRLASASDDRSLRLWELPDRDPGDTAESAPMILSAAMVLHGHQARLWDVQFLGDLVISGSEDCTCRFGLHSFWNGF